jgi:hypothetical protein
MAIHLVLLSQSREQLCFLQDLLQNITQEQFIQPLPVMSDSTIGKHVRHVVEFYQCLIAGFETGVVNYDARPRNSDLEEIKSEAEKILALLQMAVSALQDKTVNLLVSDGAVSLQTTIGRELAYNTEHCIHHLAIIKMGVKLHFSHINMSKEIGLAYATLAFQHQLPQA